MIQFLKTKDVKDPIREVGNAGIDIFIPNKSNDFIQALNDKNVGLTFTEDEIKIQPLQSILIPSGLKTKFKDNLTLIVTNKSGVALKKQLMTGACVIDSSYQGELLIHLINVSSKEVSLKFGEKIVQLIPHLIDTTSHTVTNDEINFFETLSNRGEGGFGSTGNV